MNLSRPYQEQNFSEWMDQFRWIAALIVAISHIGGPLLVALSAMPAEQRPVPQYFYSFIAGFAHQSVIIFFVLSGYFVGGALCFEANKREPEALSYFSKRLSRLWVVLIPTLVISYILYKIGYSLAPIVYDTRKDNAVDFNTFSCNIFFMQNVFCTRFASNDSLWSLFNEFWYYVSFFFIVLGMVSKSLIKKITMFAIAICFLVFFSLFQFSNAPLIPYMFIWLSGVYIAWAGKPKYLTSPYMAGGLLITYLVLTRVILGTSNMHGTSLISFVADFGLTLLFVKLLINMKFSNYLPRPILGKTNIFLASFSYTLYCIHLPLALFYSAVTYYLWGLGHEMIADTFIEWLVVFGCIVIVIISSYLLSLVTEKHTNTIRKFVYSRISRKV